MSHLLGAPRGLEDQAAVSREDGGSAQLESLPRLQDFGFLADWGFVVPHPLQVIITYFIAMFPQVETSASTTRFMYYPKEIALNLVLNWSISMCLQELPEPFRSWTELTARLEILR